MEQTKWFPHKAFTDDLQYNSFFSDLLHTSEQNVLAIDQTAGMFGMEARVPLLTQRYAHHIMNMPTNIRFKQIEGFAPGTTKYLARVGLANFIPDHITSRKSKVGWSSPWDNNVNDVAHRWKLRDLELLRRLG
jgi:asparagine synthetase B (glutamine-hydrolysing)